VRARQVRCPALARPLACPVIECSPDGWPGPELPATRGKAVGELWGARRCQACTYSARRDIQLSIVSKHAQCRSVDSYYVRRVDQKAGIAEVLVDHRRGHSLSVDSPFPSELVRALQEVDAQGIHRVTAPRAVRLRRSEQPGDVQRAGQVIGVD
jgi:hypothetical protein